VQKFAQIETYLIIFHDTKCVIGSLLYADHILKITSPNTTSIILEMTHDYLLFIYIQFIIYYLLFKCWVLLKLAEFIAKSGSTLYLHTWNNNIIMTFFLYINNKFISIILSIELSIYIYHLIDLLNDRLKMPIIFYIYVCHNFAIVSVLFIIIQF
jgi:hypothetical protein